MFVPNVLNLFLQETVGKTFGAHNMAQRGREQHAAGEAEISAAKTQGYAE